MFKKGPLPRGLFLFQKSENKGVQADIFVVL